MEYTPKPATIFGFTEETESGDPGRTFKFTSVNIEPLGYAALENAKPHSKVSIPIRWKDATIVSASVNEIDRNLTYTVTGHLNSDFTARAIGLIKGGWLPSALAASDLNTIVMVDRNTVTQIKGRFEQGKPKYPERDFIDLFADKPIRIHPMLFGMEGNTKGIPTPEQVRAQIKEAVSTLKAALPSAEIMADAGHITGALGLIEDSRHGLEQKQLFLMRLAPILAAPVSGKNMHRLWDKVLAVADQYGVPRKSLVVLAALSAVVVPNGCSPTKRLLKCKQKYSEGDAYNALCDIRALEILISGFAMYPAQPMQLCTADRDLALFWVGIGASNFRYSGNTITYELSLREELLPEAFLKKW